MNARTPRAGSLLLVKHAMPLVDPAKPAATWALSDAGRAACAPLAEQIAGYAPEVAVASEEPKATETGRLVAARRSLPFETAPGLHEHDRTGVPFLGIDAWSAALRRFFAEPDTFVLGRETATQIGDRFERAVVAVLDRHPSGNPVIVAHGTVIGLFVARHNPVDPFALWERLGLPSFVILDRSSFQIVDLHPSVV